jgi:hypothetical protein
MPFLFTEPVFCSYMTFFPLFVAAALISDVDQSNARYINLKEEG